LLKQGYQSANQKAENAVISKIKLNPKAFFSFAKTKQKTRAKIGSFLDTKTKKINQDPENTAEVLRQQYDSVFRPTRSQWKVDDPVNFYKIPEGETSYLANFLFNHEDIEKACAELKANSAPGPDSVPASLLKECRKELSHPLSIFWRASLDQGSIPEELLLVQVCPQHKGGSRAEPAQYRPVALTSHLMKTWERVVRRHLVDHLDQIGLLPDGQHGSRAQRSTLTQLLAHWDSVLDDLEASPGCDTIYLDFAKGYDKCKTGVLQHKLKSAKVLGKVGVWLSSFLSAEHRKQAVAVEGDRPGTRVFSALSPVVSGVPQGTVIAPVLFLLMIANIARGVASTQANQTRVSSFVDDTRVKKGIRDPTSDCTALQKDLQSIYDWAEDVGLVFNSTKFECVRHWPREGAPQQPYLSPAGLPIEEKPFLQDLGVQLSSDLTFSHQLDKVVTSASQMVGWVMRSFSTRSHIVMKTCWNSMVQSRLDYCSQLWSPSDQASIARLEGVARSYTRQVQGMEGLDYIERLKKLKMYSQERRRERYKIIFIWKVGMGMIKGYNLPFTHNPRTGWRVTPAPVPASAPAAVRTARRSSLAHQGAQLFNMLPKGLRDLSSARVELFKCNLDAFLTDIPDEPTVPERQRAAATNSLLDWLATTYS
jgi:hypothetical protein